MYGHGTPFWSYAMHSSRFRPRQGSRSQSRSRHQRLRRSRAPAAGSDHAARLSPRGAGCWYRFRSPVVARIGCDPTARRGALKKLPQFAYLATQSALRLRVWVDDEAICEGALKKFSWMNRSCPERKIPKPGWLWYQPTICSSGGKSALEHTVDMSPSLLSERQRGPLLISADRWDRAGDERQTAIGRHAPNQHATDLAICVGEYMRIDHCIAETGLQPGDFMTVTCLSASAKRPRRLEGIEVVAPGFRAIS